MGTKRWKRSSVRTWLFLASRLAIRALNEAWTVPSKPTTDVNSVCK